MGVFVARFLENGDIAFADQGTQDVYIVDPDGRIDGRLGGLGDGPGEFRQISSIVPLQTDSFLVLDYRTSRVSLIASGEFVRDTRYEAGPVGQLHDSGLSANGRFLATPSAMVFGEPGWATAPVSRVDSEFESAEAVMERYVLRVRERGDRNPISHWGFMEFDGRHIVTVRTDRPEVQWWTPDGVLAQVSRWDAESRAVTEDDWGLFEAAFRERHEDRADLGEMVRERREDFAGPLPVLWRIHEGGEDVVWVSEYDLTHEHRRSGRYWILSRPDGWLGYADLPPAAEVMHVRAERILVVESNELGVQSVAVYRVRRAN